MSVRHGLLALLARKESYGYELRAGYEHETGTPALNIGQVYSTLRRLERDGFVIALDDNDHDRTSYRLTPVGRASLQEWFATPLTIEKPGRDELVVKIHLAITTPGIDAHSVITAQRAATLQALQRITAVKARTAQHDIVALINIDFAISRAEAELTWLELATQRLTRAAHDPNHGDPK